MRSDSCRKVRGCDAASETTLTHPVVGLSEDRVRLEAGMKLQIVNLLKAFRVLRFPIMVVNVVTIIVMLLIG